MGQTLYLECNSGISGDMAVAALLDLGADEEALKKALYSLPLSGFVIETSRVKKAGLDVCDFDVKLDGEHENHDHDMEYLHGHHKEHHHHEGHHHEGHSHRGLPEIEGIINGADISGRAKETALRIFGILASAEAKAHGTDINDVHFHETGAVDSIVDIVAAAVCLDNLDITDVIVPNLCEGSGTVRCQHGVLPVPVPAVLNIVQMYNIPLQLTGVQGELVTPTGAAITAAIRTKEALPAQFCIKKTGMGGGKRNYERPSILRAMLIQEETTHKEEGIYKLETNIDDCTGEMLGHVMECLFENGAADVHYTPIFMKKNRPAYLLSVLCRKEDVSRMEDIIFKGTTTIGIRRARMERTALKRETETIQLPCGSINIKKCILPDGSIRRYPEYETAAAIAKEKNMALKDVMDIYYKYAEETGHGRD